MKRVLVFGAGSIGNHLTHGCRRKGWDVVVCDVDAEALERMRSSVYPSRYGSWDEAIRLCLSTDRPREPFDLVIVGTPPDTHVAVALEAIDAHAPKVLLIEKPMCPPSLEGADSLARRAAEKGVTMLVGYNHVMTPNTREADEILASGDLGAVRTIQARWLEHWGGIFRAHPWLAGPHDSYLGFWRRGGGACGEHSHAINLWQHFARVAGAGRVTTVGSMMDIVSENRAEYDRVAQLNLRTENGLVGSIIQDVVTEPAVKTIRIQGEHGYLEWYAGYDKSHDALLFQRGNSDPEQRLIRRTRPDDFKGEVDEVERLLDGPEQDSEIAFEHGMETMRVVAAAYQSQELGQTVSIQRHADS